MMRKREKIKGERRNKFNDSIIGKKYTMIWEKSLF